MSMKIAIINGNTKCYTAGTGYLPVADFYKGKSVFLTGGLGFLGKALTEKLLYATELDKIYMLIRENKGIDVHTRLENILDDPLFSRLKEIKPERLAKIIPIKGDIVSPNLGINQEDQKTLTDKVSIVFHAAAIVKFNDPLSTVMNTNYKGTKHVLNFCKRIKNVEAFIHVSTAYAHTPKQVLLETIYPPPAELKDVHKFLDEYGDSKRETKKFLKEYFSTYNFSKAMSEYNVATEHGNIPTAIVRPSIVSPSINEPMQGWTDNWFAITNLLHNYGKGWDFVTYGNSKNIADIIPVDYVTNLIIIAASRLQGSKKIHVYNITSSSVNPITYKESINIFREECIRIKQNEVPHMFHVFTKSKKLINILTIMFQKIPAHIAVFFLKIRGKEPKYANIISRVIAVRNEYESYTSKSWIMNSDNSRKVYSELSPEDKKLFPCDPANINWSEYFKVHCNGVFKYLKPKYTARNG